MVTAHLGRGRERALGEISGNVNADQEQIFGKKDNHVPPSGRDLIRKTLHDNGVCFSFYEVAHAQRLSSPFPSLSLPNQLCPWELK